jgi:hypothetical protein
LFYPFPTLASLNPSTLSLSTNDLVKKKQGVAFIDQRLYVSAVSRLFLDIVRDRLEIVIVPFSKDSETVFHWDTQFIDSHQLEEAYVTIALSNEFDADSHVGSVKALRQHLAEREKYLRARFQEYIRRFQLFRAKDVPLALHITRDGEGHVVVEELSV